MDVAQLVSCQGTNVRRSERFAEGRSMRCLDQSDAENDGANGVKTAEGNVAMGKMVTWRMPESNSMHHGLLESGT